MPAPKSWASARSSSSRATAGRSMRSPMSWRCRAASATASPGCAHNTEDWAGESFLQVHNWWHLALFHYELGETEEALALFDAPIYGKHSTLALNMLDASAMLWRLHLRGVDVGDRWAALAANWAPKASRQLRLQRRACDDGLCRCRARRAGARCCSRHSVRRWPAGGDNADFTRDVGHPVALAIQAFGDGDYPRGGRASPPGAQNRLPLRRQPCAARRHRPDANRGRFSRRRHGTCVRAVGGTRSGAAG